MCGRYRLKDPKAAFDWIQVVAALAFLPRFNIAPTQSIAVLSGSRQLEEMTWGMTPPWATKVLVNARAESVREKRSFKESAQRRRCLVPADGFYEWSRLGKRPHLFTVKGGAPFVMGGIWEQGADVHRCCLLTTSANSVMEPVHDRMPVIISRQDWDEWLSPEPLDDQCFGRLTRPYVAHEMAALKVSPIVNNARVDDARCCEPATAEDARPKLAIRRGKREKPAEDDPQGMLGL